MNPLLSPSQLDTAIKRGGWYIVIGFPLFLFSISIHNYLSTSLQHQTIVSLLMATLLGAICGIFTKWREEGGWLIAIIVLILVFPIYLMFAAMEWLDINEHRNIGFAIDVCLSAVFVGKACRILLSVVVQNWRIPRAKVY